MYDDRGDRCHWKADEGATAMHLVCDCCGYAREFQDADEAFRAGWDGPAHFTGYMACDRCPSAFIVLGQTHRHGAVHQRWIAEGRPRAQRDSM